ncbi:hypothetical protein BJ875DRAFT_365083 [Amylocarpus encephaloides]|uniref:CRIB domain-containing protein n=1 Tax=Amylocarpus encephaloides TaxID=45428 RepID=A0A9P7YTV2_9HELO|nr:hypothetical protein BJ875DRAFT_365083 [Amylocarpus encephaloides]
MIVGGILEEGSAKDHYYGRGAGSRRGVLSGSQVDGPGFKRRQPISGPYNFQHVTHTHKENLPNLEQTSPKELSTEFSAIRTSQLPTHGELKGIRAQDLHFENFSSEALNVLPEEGQAQSFIDQKSPRPSLSQGAVSHTRSHENLRISPPRPPRSPLSPICPVALPARTSSRTASVLFETFDPLATTSIERPQTSSGFRRPAPFGLPIPPQQTAIWEVHRGEDVEDANTISSHALTTPDEEAWPLTASLSGTFGSELTDVQEEEEAGSRNEREGSQIQACQSVPSLRPRASEQRHEPFDSQILKPVTGEASTSTPIRPLSPAFCFDDDSWEQDIDYCYDHEIEADCDYQWDQCSMEEESTVVPDPTSLVQPTLELHLEDDVRSVYHGRFRPSLLIPSAYDVPELSPMSNASAVSSDPRTPQNFLRANHVRSSSHASSFKESHGFNLSPSLLIPSDFQAQMEEEAYSTYHSHFSKNDLTSVTILDHEPFNGCSSPIDETSSSIVSYRSSNFSRESARSSSSTRLSSTTSRLSGDVYRSFGSSSSLPDLIPSTLRKHESAPIPSDDVAVDAVEEGIKTDNVAVARQPNSPAVDARPGSVVQLAPLSTKTELLGELDNKACLSPVAEVSTEELISRTQIHGRKVSAPVVSQTAREFKGRPRAGTCNATTTAMGGGKKRGSYMLFPQV